MTTFSMYAVGVYKHDDIQYLLGTPTFDYESAVVQMQALQADSRNTLKVVSIDVTLSEDR